VDIDTEASATIVRPGITAGLHEGVLNQTNILRTASGENLVLREVLEKVTGQSALRICLFVAEITCHYAAG
jgi:hypothetical protein